MNSPLFDPALAALKRRRAERMGPDYFLHERAFEDILDRIDMTRRRFGTVLLLGHVGADWPTRLQALGLTDVQVVPDLGSATLAPAADLCVSVGALDTAEPLPAVLAALRFALAPDALFIGALPGGDSLPALRRAMRAADEIQGSAAPHTHPRIDAPSFAGLLADAGFLMPVVDIDRVQLRYDDLDALVRDLRAMAATNRLHERPRRPLLRRELQQARGAFAAGAKDGRVSETIDILHFAAWTPPSAEQTN